MVKLIKIFLNISKISDNDIFLIFLNKLTHFNIFEKNLIILQKL